MVTATRHLLPFHSVLLATLSCVVIAVILFLFISDGGDGSASQQRVPQPHPPQQRFSEPLIFGETAAVATTSELHHQEYYYPRRSIINDDEKSSNIMTSSRNMVGGYSSTMDAKAIVKDSEITDIANFAFREYITSPSSPTNAQEVSSSPSLFVVTPEELVGDTTRVQIQVLEAQTQVVAGLNYKFTLAILEGGNNNSISNNNNNFVCRGFLRGITVYKPLPHTGQGLSVTSWGKQIDCTDEELLKLLNDATNDATTMMAAEEEAKENALDVEDNLEEEWEEVEPDS